MHSGSRFALLLLCAGAQVCIAGVAAPFSLNLSQLGGAKVLQGATIASGRNFTYGLATTSDGSILFGESLPTTSVGIFYGYGPSTTGSVWKLPKQADGSFGAAQKIIDNLAGIVTNVRVLPNGYILVDSGSGGAVAVGGPAQGTRVMSFYTAAGAALASVNFSYPAGGWEHSTGMSLVVGNADGTNTIYFIVGSQVDQAPTTQTVTTSGLMTAVLQGDSIYGFVVDPSGGALKFVSGPVLIANGLRNPFGLSVNGAGDLLIADNGIDGAHTVNELGADTLKAIPQADLGKKVYDFGFPNSYVEFATGNWVFGNANAIRPLLAFVPLANSSGSLQSSEGIAGMAYAPVGSLPFVGAAGGVMGAFHGVFDAGGSANYDNALVYYDSASGKAYPILDAGSAGVGHIDSVWIQGHVLYLADMSVTGVVNSLSGVGGGAVYAFDFTSLMTTQVTIAANITGATFTLEDGSSYAAPVTFSWATGSSHTVTWQVGTAVGTRYVFQAWADGGANPREITVPASAATYTASFKTQYQLNTWASPGAGGSVSPVSGAYFDAGSIVPVVATASAGYFFSGWTGAAASLINASTTVTMSGPAAATAIFTPALITLPGVPNYLGMFVSSNVLGNSVMYQSGQSVSIGGTTSLGAMTLIGSAPSGDTAGMALYNSAGGGGASVSLDMYNTFANGGIPQAKIKALDDGAYSDHLTFLTKNPGGPGNALGERVRVTSAGSVGIGTKTPSAAMEVVGSIKITGTGNEIIFPNGTTKSRGLVRRAVDVGDRPGGVAFDGTAVWVAGDAGVSKVIAATGVKVGTYRAGPKPAGIAFDGFHVWVANTGSGTVTKLLAATGAVVGEYRVGESPQGVAFDGEHIWVANSGSGDVTELMAETGVVAGTYRVGEKPTGIAFDGMHLWVTNAGSGTVSKLRDGAVVGSYPVGASPLGIAYDGKNLWVANSGSGDVLKLSANGAILGRYPVGGAPVVVVFDGRDIWVGEATGTARLAARVK